jgi:hypothetical protein
VIECNKRAFVLLECSASIASLSPHSCHVDQNGLNSRIWRACRHLPAFNGVQSAFHRRNHCGAARRRTSRPKPNYTTTIAVSVGSSVRRPEKISKSVSRVPGRQRGLLDRTIKIRRGGRPSLPAEFYEPHHLLPGGVHFVRCGLGFSRMHSHGA